VALAVHADDRAEQLVDAWELGSERLVVAGDDVLAQLRNRAAGRSRTRSPSVAAGSVTFTRTAFLTASAARSFYQQCCVTAGVIVTSA
jgi:hypothetical protein